VCVRRHGEQRVQEVLDAQRQTGERCWRHHHYLRGSIFCGECGARLIYTRATGRAGGIYEYFVCGGRMEGSCSQPHHRVAAVERAVEDEYARIELSTTRRAEIRTSVQAYVASIDAKAEPERQQITETLRKLTAQEKKLLQAHYDEYITPKLFAQEQQRIRRERISSEQRQAELQVDHGRTLERLDIALGMTDRVQAAYLIAEPNTRRIFNQAIFARIWIDREQVAASELVTPFSELLREDEQMMRPKGHVEPAETRRTRRDVARDDTNAVAAELPDWRLQAGPNPESGAGSARTSTEFSFRGGSNVLRMVRPRGLEPPRTN